MIVRDKALMDGGITPALIKGCITDHNATVERMKKLAEAYASNPPIKARSTIKGMPNNKLVHNYGRYIVAVSSGYLVGNPVTYQSEDNIDDLASAYQAADVESVDAELAKDAALYGKGVELCFADEDARPQTAALDPMSAFVVYDNDIANTPIMGIRYYDSIGANGKKEASEIVVYTDAEILTYKGKDTTKAAESTPLSEPHFFGGVPMVEYWNNDDETGDFEHVQSLIDAYDLLQSDRVNDKEQLVQAILVLTGARLEVESDTHNDDGTLKTRGRTPGEQLRQDKMLMLPDKDAEAYYLTKNLSEADVEILKDSIKSDIHKFSMVPDLSDVNFAGNASGVAMRYKLFGLEQLTKVKERWFKEALRERLRRFAYFLQVKGAKTIDPDAVKIIFKRALPANEFELAQMVAALNRMVPQEILLGQLPFIEDATEAAKLLEEEHQEALKRQQMAFGMPLAGDDE